MTIHNLESTGSTNLLDAVPDPDGFEVAQIGSTAGNTSAPAEWPGTVSGLGPSGGYALVVAQDGTLQVDDGDIPRIPAWDGADAGTTTITAFFRLRRTADGQLSDEARIDVVLRGNRPPTFDLAAGIEVEEGTTYALTPSGVASDPDGKTLSFVSAPTATNGTVTAVGDGTYTYTAPAAATGPDSIAVTVADHLGSQVTENIAVTVTAAATANNPPVITTEPLAMTYTEGLTVWIRPSQLASDPDGDPVVLQSVSANASIQNGLLVYTVPEFATGTDTITYTVSDGQGGTADGTINVTIEEDTTGYVETPTSFLSSSTYIEDETNKLEAADGSLIMLAFEITPDVTQGGHDILHLLTDAVNDLGLKFYQQGSGVRMTLTSGATTLAATGFLQPDRPTRVLMTVDGSGAGSVRRIVYRNVGEGDWKVAASDSASAEGLVPFNSAVKWTVGRSAYNGGRHIDAIVERLMIWNAAPDITSADVQRYFDTPGGKAKDPSVAIAGIGTPLKSWTSPAQFAAEPGANGTFAAP